MKALIIEATDKTPQVNFDPESGVFEIKGKSIPADAESFYGPVLAWMESYVKSPGKKTHFELNLEYFNITSSKRILFILYKLNELIDKSHDVHVKWYYAESDDDMHEVGQDYAFMVKVPFQFVGYKKDLKPAMA